MYLPTCILHTGKRPILLLELPLIHPLLQCCTCTGARDYHCGAAFRFRLCTLFGRLRQRHTRTAATVATCSKPREGLVCTICSRYCRSPCFPFLATCSGYFHIRSFLIASLRRKASLPQHSIQQSWSRQRSPSGTVACLPILPLRPLDLFVRSRVFGRLLSRLPWPCRWLVYLLRSSRARLRLIPLPRTFLMRKLSSCRAAPTDPSRVLAPAARRASCR